MRVWRKFFIGFLACSLIFQVGAHWVLLQSVAWTQMLLQYSQSYSLLTAVEMTFDGQHPCSLCQTIAQASQKKKKGTLSAPLVEKLQVFKSDGLVWMPLVRKGWRLLIKEKKAPSFVSEVRLPPPKFSLFF